MNTHAHVWVVCDCHPRCGNTFCWGCMTDKCEVEE